MFHLAQKDRVPEVQVRRGGIEAGLDAERLAGLRRLLEASAQLVFANHLDGALEQIAHLLVERHALALPLQANLHRKHTE